MYWQENIIYQDESLTDQSIDGTIAFGRDGEKMKHTEYRRLVCGADSAVLFIHGIIGTPNHFQAFTALVPEHISVYNLLLDGHGKSVRDFSHTSMKKWEKQIGDVVQTLLENHKRLYIVAHSLGTLLAIEQAINDERITGMFLLAVPIKLFLKPKMVSNSAKVFFDRIRPDDLSAIAAKNCYGIENDRNPLHYLGWIPRFLELFAKIRATRKILGQLKTSCITYQSAQDEMVSCRSIAYLKENSKMEVRVLEKSAHFYYEKGDFDRLLSSFSVFIRNI